MIKQLRKLLWLIAALFAVDGYAHDVEIDGIYYNLDEENMTASVTFRGEDSGSYKNEYTGDVVIPSSITCYGKAYSVTSIENSAFWHCEGLTSITMPEGVTSIGAGAFDDCRSLTSINIPEGVTSIDSFTFYNCRSLTSVTIPEKVTSIGSYAFYCCHGLTSVTIPLSVTSIGEYAFRKCRGLTEVYSFNSVPPVVARIGCFFALHEDVVLYVPKGSVEAYRGADGWNEFVDIREFDTTDISSTEAVCGCEDVYYGLSGRRHMKPQRGVNIIRYSDGSTRKVLVK